MTIKSANFCAAPLEHAGRDQGIRPFDIFVDKQVQSGVDNVRFDPQRGNAVAAASRKRAGKIAKRFVFTSFSFQNGRNNLRLPYLQVFQAYWGLCDGD